MVSLLAFLPNRNIEVWAVTLVWRLEAAVDSKDDFLVDPRLCAALPVFHALHDANNWFGVRIAGRCAAEIFDADDILF